MDNTMKVIIAGSQTFLDAKRLERICDNALKHIRVNIQVVCGMAKGADTLGFDYAKKRGYSIHEMPADWDNMGNKAGMVRNGAMADYADMLIAFWDGKSPGTENMIEHAKDRGLRIILINYSSGQVFI